MKEQVFTIGQKVIATGRLDGYRNHLTEGKEYTVTQYEPSYPSDLPNFTWPAYVFVTSDNGERLGAHTYRFKPVKEGATKELPSSTEPASGG
jgi:hypothetical protein